MALEGAATTPLLFGIFDWIDRSGLELAEAYEQRLRMLEYADDAGFYCYHLAEHHCTPLSAAPSPGIFLAAAAQRTRRIHLGPLVYLLPLYNPIRLINEICMLDHLSRGRLEVGIGRGVVPYELAIYNVDPQAARAIFNEALAIVVRGLSTGEISHEGRYFSFRNVRLQLRPYQHPYPPIWCPTSNPESVTWVAQEGLNTAAQYLPLSDLRQLIDTYKRVWQEHRHKPNRLNGHVTPPKYGIVRYVYVAEDDSQALREAKAAFAQFSSNFNHLWSLHDNPYSNPLAIDFEAGLEAGQQIVGSPATVRAKVKEQVETTGCNYFLGAFAYGSLTSQQIMNSLHLFSQEVMPAFRQIGAEVV